MFSLKTVLAILKKMERHPKIDEIIREIEEILAEDN